MRFLAPAARRESVKRFISGDGKVCDSAFSDPTEVGNVHFDTLTTPQKVCVLHFCVAAGARRIARTLTKTNGKLPSVEIQRFTGKWKRKPSACAFSLSVFFRNRKMKTFED